MTDRTINNASLKGGHFPAMEEPELFVTDIQKFGKMLKSRKAFD